MCMRPWGHWHIAIAILATAVASFAAAVAGPDDNVAAAATSGIDLQQHYGPFSGSNGPFSSGGNGRGGNSNSGIAGGRNGDGFPGLFGDELQRAIHIRNAHGILASLAIVVLFPVGSILMRIVPGRLAIWAHGLFQMFAFVVFIAGAGLGIYMVTIIKIPFNGGTLLSNPYTNIHPIMGLVTLVTLLFQPILGFVHHARFKQVGRRTFWTTMHLWNGRIGITVGIVNGGLGIRLANAQYSVKVAYIIVAVIIWFIWFVIAVVSETRRRRQQQPNTAVPVGVPYRGDGRGGAGRGVEDGPGAYYAARAPVGDGAGTGKGGFKFFRRSPAPEMTATRTVSMTGPGGGAGAASRDGDDAEPLASRPRRSGERSPKVRESHSSSGRSISPARG